MARADGATSDEEGPEDEEKRGGHRTEGEGAAGFEEEWAAAVAPLPRLGPGPPGGGYTPVAFPTVNRFCMALLYGRAGCLTAPNGGSRQRASRSGSARCRARAPVSCTSASTRTARPSASIRATCA